MESSEVDKSVKEAKDATKESKTGDSQVHFFSLFGFKYIEEQTSATAKGTVNPDWTGFQHIMPPYGTPPHPYVAMYPPGGIYAHPSMPPGTYPFSPYAMPSPNGVAEACGNTPGDTEVDRKLPDGKEKLPIKRSKGSLGSLNIITLQMGLFLWSAKWCLVPPT